MRIRKIDYYIFRKFLGTFIYAISLLILVVIVIDISEKVDDFIDKRAPLSEILFQYYVNFIPYFINLFSPLFTFIAVVFFTSKMASRSEIVAILSSGISFNRLLRPYVLAAFLLGLTSFYLSNFVIPITNRTLLEFEYRYIKNPPTNREKDIHMQVRPGKFVYLESFNSELNIGQRFTMEEMDEKRGMYSKLGADVIRWDSLDGSWVLDNYYHRVWDGHMERLSRGAQLDTMLEIRPEDFRTSIDDVMLMNFTELRRFIEKQRLVGNKQVAEFEVEKHKRIAFPFATIVLTLIGVALSSRKVRGGIGMHLGLGIALSFTFIMFMQVSTTFAVYGNLHPAAAVWLPNVLYGIIAAFLIRWAPK